MAAIQFDHNQTIAQAKQLEELSSNINAQCVKALADIMTNIDAAWTGDASRLYLRALSSIQEELADESRYARDTAEFLRAAAQKLREAEAAAKAASQRI